MENSQGSWKTQSGRTKLQHPSKESLAQSAETPVSPETAPSMEASREFILSEQSAPQDSKKDKAQKRAQQGWLKSLLNFILRSGPEEPKEKVDRTKGKEGLSPATEIPAAPGQPALRKKSHDKKHSRKKSSSKKQGAEETVEIHDQEAEGPEAGLPKVVASWDSKKEANQDPSGRAGEDSDPCQGAGVLEAALQGTRPQPEEKPRKADRDSIIQNIVEIIKKVADFCEKENGAGAAGTTSFESKPLRRPSYLPLRVEVHQYPISSTSGLEERKAREALTTEGGGVSPLENLPGARGQEPAEDLPLDKDGASESKDAIIQIIVEFLKKEELQVLHPENPTQVVRKKSQEKKMTFKKVFSKKKCSVESRKVGTAGAGSLESRPHKKTSFLCVGGPRPSISSVSGLEERKAREALTTEGGGVSPLENLPGAGGQEPAEDLPLDKDGASESKDDIINMIVEFLKKIGDQYEKEELRVPPPKAPQNPPVTRKKSQEKKTSLKRVFSKRKISEESRRVETAAAVSLESRPHKKTSFLCVGAHRSSIASASDPEVLKFQESSPAEGDQVVSSEEAPQTRSHKAEGGPQLDGECDFKERIFQKLSAILQEVSDQLSDQIRRKPGLKKYFREIIDASLEKLVSTMPSQEPCSTEPDRSLVEKPYQGSLLLGLPNKFADNNSHNVVSLMDLTGHYGRRHSCSQFSYKEAQQNVTSPEIQSPD